MRTVKTILVVLLASLSAAAQDNDHFGQDFAPSLSPDGTQVVYYAYREAPGALPDLYLADVATGREVRLTTTPGLFEIEPAWTPDGSKITFAAGPTMGELAIYSINPDGSDYRLLYDGDGAGPPRWSADGSKLVFWTGGLNAGESELLVLDYMTGDQRVVETGLGGRNASPNWTPDGRHLVFSHMSEDAGAGGLYRIALTGGPATRLTHDGRAAYSPVMSPDGAFLYFMAEGDTAAMQIYRVAVQGGTPEPMTASENAPAYFPRLSLDGRQLLFAGRTPDGHTRIMTMPTNAPRTPGEVLTKDFVN